MHFGSESQFSLSSLLELFLKKGCYNMTALVILTDLMMHTFKYVGSP